LEATLGFRISNVSIHRIEENAIEVLGLVQDYQNDWKVTQFKCQGQITGQHEDSYIYYQSSVPSSTSQMVSYLN